MENEEILQYLSKLERKLDKILNLQTKIAKTLHLLPVTEKEERAIQLQQRENLSLARKVSDDLDTLANIKQISEDNALGISIYDNASQEEIYIDILGNDILGG